jgi:GR25 family glycosyltransferase involved in LPS biosynthesis
MNRTYVINLVSRPDRRREMEAELVSSGWPGPVEWLTERRPTDKGDWSSIGYKGCFMSHFKVLIRGRDSGHSSFAVLEDDCEFWPGAVQRLHVIERSLEEREWDLCYLGHYLPTASDDLGMAEISPWQPIPTTHAYLVNRRAVPALIEWFDRVSCRPKGSPLGGPQSPDGALSTYRAQNPTVRTFAASPPHCKQRPSRSEMSPRWFDVMPGLRDLAGVGRRLRRLGTKL